MEPLDLDRKYLDVLHLRVEERHVRRSRERGNDSPHGACRNAPNRARGSGMKSATNSRRRRFAARFVDTSSQNPSTSGSPSVRSRVASSASASRPRASAWRSNATRSSSAVQVSEACAASPIGGLTASAASNPGGRDPFMNLLTRRSTYNSPMARSLRETDRSTCSKCGTSPGTWTSSSFVQRRRYCGSRAR